MPAATLAQIFQAAIAELTGDDYSEAQQEAWASVADDVADFAVRLGGQLTLGNAPGAGTRVEVTW